MTRWPEQVKKKARLLREEGLSYSELTKKLGVSKSTLHSWIYDLKRPEYITNEQKRKHLERIRPLAKIAIRQKREKRLNEIKQRIIREVDKYPLKRKDYLRSMLAMLYWAEGTKTRGTLAFANTDPSLVLLFLTLLRKCYEIDENRLRVRLHLHYYHKAFKVKRFWSKLLNIPDTKFGKIYFKPRSKTKRFRHNFMGICYIKYYSEDLRFEILERARLLADRITGNVPVA